MQYEKENYSNYACPHHDGGSFPALPVYAATTTITPTGGNKSGTGWEWVESTYTLTLSGTVAIPSGEITFEGDFNSGSVIIKLTDYTGATPSINFSGVTITNGTFGAPTYGSAIYFVEESGSHPVIFNFTGTNRIYGNDSTTYGGYGILKKDSGSITINGSVDIFGGNSTGTATGDRGGYGIVSLYGDVIINATGPINIVGGNSNAGDSGTSIYTNNDLTINGSAAVNITGGNSAAGWGYYCICAKNVTMDNSNTTIRGGNVAGSTGNGGEAILALGSVTINKAATITGGDYNGTEATPDRNGGGGIVTRNGGTININGTEQVRITGGNSIGATGNGGYGIYLYDNGSLVISNPNAVITGGNSSGSGTKVGYAGSAIYIPNATKTVTLPYSNITNLVPGTGNTNGSKIFIGADYYNQTSGKYNTLSEMKTNPTQIIFTGTEPTAPDAPTAVTATAGNGQASVSFTVPSSNGGSPVTSYTVTSSPDGKTATGAASPVIVTGLTNGTAYTFTVTATNIAGTGSSSTASGAVIPVKPVTDITGVPATGTAGTEIDLTGATVNPSDATYKTIVWSVKDAGTTGVTTANLATGKFTPATAGTLVLTATITKGLTESTNYTKDVTITVAASPNKAITAFNFNGLTPNVTGTVNETAKTIALTVPYGTNVTALVPTITQTGASISPNTNVAQNFTSPVTYTVTAADSSTQAYTVTVTRAALPAASDGTSTTTTPTSTVVEVNGQKQDAGTSSIATSGGQTVTTIKVDATKLDKILESSGEKPTVTLPSTGSDVTVGELNGQTVKNMENKEAVLEIKTDSVTYTLPAAEINIDDVSKLMGSQVALKDIKVSVSIAEPTADTVKIVQDTANKNSYQLVVKPVEFEITCTSGGKTVEVSKFNAYVERTVAIPAGIDPTKITTGIVLNSDGTFSHVPTTIIKIDGKYFAKIKSLTNSTYSVIYNPVEFADVANHWAKTAINDMGSRMVVTGVGSSTYEPDRSITRAEFATVVVRALGLQKGTTESNFGDVSLSDWFNGYVDTATEYSLITGYDSTSYGPNDTITREQAMAIIARTMKLTGLSVSLTDSETSLILAKYTDGVAVSDYAKTSTAMCIKTGVVTGSSATTLSPKAYVTRAEVAVMVQRLLQKSGLI